METVYEKEKNMRTESNPKKEETKEDTECSPLSIPNDQNLELIDRFKMNKDFVYAKKGDFDK